MDLELGGLGCDSRCRAGERAKAGLVAIATCLASVSAMTLLLSVSICCTIAASVGDLTSASTRPGVWRVAR